MKKVLLITVCLFVISVVSASAGEYWGYVGNNNSRRNSSILNKHVAANTISPREQYRIAQRVVSADVRRQEARTRRDEISNIDKIVRVVDNGFDAVENGARAVDRWIKVVKNSGR